MTREKKETKEITEKKDFVDTLISVKRVTKVTKGGKRFSFAAFVVSGNQDGMVGIGLGKGREASVAIAKATVRARKKMIPVATRGTTLPFAVEGRHGSAHIVIRPAYRGTGVIAGKAARAVFAALNITDVLAKSIGPSRSGQNVVKATLNALAKCRTIGRIAQLRGKSVEQIVKGAHHHA